jgi:uncharacterized protein YodC (DUF2158 family)
MEGQMAFKTGDVVKLKSGGPLMTVTLIGDRYGMPIAYCSWFEGTNNKSADFPPDSLEIAAKPGPTKLAQ